MTESRQENVADEAALERGQFRRDWVGRISYAIFSRRRLLLIVFVLVTLALGAMASQLRVQAGFTKMIPLHHPYMATFLQYAQDFGGANKVLVAVRNTNTRGSVFEKDFMETLRRLTEDVFFINGVERSSVTSLYTTNVRYTEVVEDGFRGGNIVAADFSGEPEQLRQVRENVLKSDWVGRIVSNDQSAAMVVATLQENDPDTGERLDLQGVARQLEAIRAKYEKNGVTVHIIGFAKAMGDIASGAAGVLRLLRARVRHHGDPAVLVLRLARDHHARADLRDRARDLAARPAAALRSRARSDVDPRAVPDLLDRRLACGADDECLAARDAARRRRRHGVDALVPETLHSWRHGAARQCARLHGHRVRRYRDRARARVHGHDRRDRHDPDQQDPAADPALVLPVHARAGLEAGGQGDGRRLALGTHRRSRDEEGRVGAAAWRASRCSRSAFRRRGTCTSAISARVSRSCARARATTRTSA